MSQVEGIPLEPLDLSDLRESRSFDLAVDTSGLGNVLVTPQRATVRVRVEPAVERVMAAVPVEVESPPSFGLILQPDTAGLRVTGATARLEASALEAIRLVVDGRLLEGMEVGEARRVPVGVVDVPLLLTARSTVDSVSVVRPEGEGGARQ